MSAENSSNDPYALVLADLRAKRDQIDIAIRAIENLLSGKVSPITEPNAESISPDASDDAGAFLGMSIAEAAKKLLTTKRRAMNNAEIAAGLVAGGLVMNSREPQNTVGSILTRRFDSVGDVVRVGRGTWGLAEWYRNRTFKRKAAGKAEPVADEPSDDLDGAPTEEDAVNPSSEGA